MPSVISIKYIFGENIFPVTKIDTRIFLDNKTVTFDPKFSPLIDRFVKVAILILLIRGPLTLFGKP